DVAGPDESQPAAFRQSASRVSATTAAALLAGRLAFAALPALPGGEAVQGNGGHERSLSGLRPRVPARGRLFPRGHVFQLPARRGVSRTPVLSAVLSPAGLERQPDRVPGHAPLPAAHAGRVPLFAHTLDLL